MKLNHDLEIDSRNAKVGGNDVDIDEHHLDSDTDAVDEVDVDGDGEATDSAGQKPAPGEVGPLKRRNNMSWRGLGGLPAKSRIVMLTITAATTRTLRQAKSFSWQGIRALLARWRLISLTVGVVAAIGLAGALFVLQYRPNQQTDDVAAHAAIRAASDGTVALLSYSPETIDNDLAAGKSHLTGELLHYFTGFSQYFVAPAVRRQGVKASASVLRAAVADMHPNAAVVLVFVHQTTTSKDKPDAVLSTNSVRVTLTKINGAWLIAKFEPE
jgi:Mce-associated membrane protein